MVDGGTDDRQWANASDALDPLLGQDWLPFSIVRGNHDDPGYFLKNLPLSLMQSKPWFVAASPSGLCQAQMFKVQEAWFLHIGFQVWAHRGGTGVGRRAAQAPFSQGPARHRIHPRLS